VETVDGLSIYHPRFLCIPGVGKCLDGLFYFLSILLSTCRLKKQFHFDVIDAHFSYPDGVAGALLTKLLHTPLSITVRGTHDIRHSAYLLRKPQIKFALQSARKVICVSESLRRFVLQLGVADERTRVIPNGIDANEFFPTERSEARRKLGLPPDATMLLSVGAFIEGKGHQRIIEIASLLLAQFPKLLLVMLGDQQADPNYFRETTQLVRTKNLEKHVLLVSAQAHRTMSDWFNAANLFCLATRSEGRCNAILEALACGLPVVTTDVGGNRELVEDTGDGLLVPFWDSAAFSAALIRGLNENWNYTAISQRARRLTWNQTTAEVMCELRRLKGPSASVESHTPAV
jgi:glycosyltransferase involved in cell wall biosynthesis